MFRVNSSWTYKASEFSLKYHCRQVIPRWSRRAQNDDGGVRIRKYDPREGLMSCTATTRTSRSNLEPFARQITADKSLLHLDGSSATSDEWGLSVSPQFVLSAHYAMLVFPNQIMQCASSTSNGSFRLQTRRTSWRYVWKCLSFNHACFPRRSATCNIISAST